MRTTKTLIRLGGCPGWSESSLGGYPGWSESSLGAQSLCWFCRVAGQIMNERTVSERLVVRTSGELKSTSWDLRTHRSFSACKWKVPIGKSRTYGKKMKLCKSICNGLSKNCNDWISFTISLHRWSFPVCMCFINRKNTDWHHILRIFILADKKYQKRPPVIFLLTVPRRYFSCGSYLFVIIFIMFACCMTLCPL